MPRAWFSPMRAMRHVVKKPIETGIGKGEVADDATAQPSSRAFARPTVLRSQLRRRDDPKFRLFAMQHFRRLTKKGGITEIFAETVT